MRSFVPMLKKSASDARMSAVSAADGSSIMMPIGTSGTVRPRSRSDSAAVATARAAGVVRRFDVRLEPDLDPVLGDGRQLAILVQRLLVRAPPPLPRRDLVERVRIRFDDDFPGRSVDGNERAGSNDDACLVQAGNRR